MVQYVVWALAVVGILITRRKARLEPDDISQAVVLDAAISRLDAEVRWLDLTTARLAGPKHRGSRT